MQLIRTPVRTYTRAAGILLFLSIICGAFGELYIPSRILADDAAATIANLQAHEGFFRIGFAAYLVEAFCDVALSLIFYVLLRPVHRDLALFSAFLGLVSTALFAVSEMFYFSAPLFLSGKQHLGAFAPEQLNALALHFLALYGVLGGLFMLFYGSASIVRGYLIFRSGYFPRFLGVLLMVAGMGFVLKNVSFVLAPAYSSDILLLPMFIAMLSVMLWMVFKGVNLEKWRALTNDDS